MNNITKGNRIKSRRRELRLTQAQLAQIVGVSLMTIVRWEKGERTPDSAIMPRLAEALNTSVAYLMGLDNNNAMARQKQELLTLATGIANEDIDLKAPITAGMDNNNIIITDWGAKRTYSFPNNDEGRKSLSQFIICSAGLMNPVVSNNITGDNNSDIKQGVVNN